MKRRRHRRHGDLRVLAFALTATGLFSRARANHLDPASSSAPGGSPAFAGFRLLHLTDLHMDLNSDFADALIARLAGVSCDAIVVTGDFRSSTREDFFPTLAATRRLIAALPPVTHFGIVGNHDLIEQLPHLEADGLHRSPRAFPRDRRRTPRKTLRLGPLRTHPWRATMPARWKLAARLNQKPAA